MEIFRYILRLHQRERIQSLGSLEAIDPAGTKHFVRRCRELRGQQGLEEGELDARSGELPFLWNGYNNDARVSGVNLISRFWRLTVLARCQGCKVCYTSQTSSSTPPMLPIGFILVRISLSGFNISGLMDLESHTNLHNRQLIRRTNLWRAGCRTCRSQR